MKVLRKESDAGVGVWTAYVLFIYMDSESDLPNGDTPRRPLKGRRSSTVTGIRGGMFFFASIFKLDLDRSGES